MVFLQNIFTELKHCLDKPTDFFPAELDDSANKIIMAEYNEYLRYSTIAENFTLYYPVLNKIINFKQLVACELTRNNFTGHNYCSYEISHFLDNVNKPQVFFCKIFDYFAEKCTKIENIPYQMLCKPKQDCITF